MRRDESNGYRGRARELRSVGQDSRRLPVSDFYQSLALQLGKGGSQSYAANLELRAELAFRGKVTRPTPGITTCPDDGGTLRREGHTLDRAKRIRGRFRRKIGTHGGV
jgi:hypothetical protein